MRLGVPGSSPTTHPVTTTIPYPSLIFPERVAGYEVTLHHTRGGSRCQVYVSRLLNNKVPNTVVYGIRDRRSVPMIGKLPSRKVT